MVSCRWWSLFILGRSWKFAWLTLIIFKFDYFSTLAIWHSFFWFFLDDLVVDKLFEGTFQCKRLLNFLIWIQNSSALSKDVFKWHIINKYAILLIHIVFPIRRLHKLWYIWTFKIFEHRRVPHRWGNFLFWEWYLNNLWSTI